MWGKFRATCIQPPRLPSSTGVLSSASTTLLLCTHRLKICRQFVNFERPGNVAPKKLSQKAWLRWYGGGGKHTLFASMIV
jgi:hypothetical protein